MTERQPWEQLPKESGPAYRAFLAYRDLGPGRTLGKAGQAVGKARGGAGAGEGGRGASGERAEGGRKDANGRIRKWAKDFRWAERASEYDHHLEIARDRARIKQVESRELRRAKQLEQQEEETLVAAQQLKLRAFEMLQGSLQVVTKETRTVSPDGHTTIVHQTIEPAGWRVRDTALLLKVARELEDTVFHPERAGINPVPGPAGPAAAAPGEVLDESARRHDAWQQEKLRSLITMDWTRPPGSAPAPAGPEPPARNGSGVPPVPASST